MSICPTLWVAKCLTFKGEGDPHGRAGGGGPLLQLPLLEGIMGLRAAFKGSGVVGVVYVVLLPRVHLICLVCILVGGSPCATTTPLFPNSSAVLAQLLALEHQCYAQSVEKMQQPSCQAGHVLMQQSLCQG